jgi:hypothetical protein
MTTFINTQTMAYPVYQNQIQAEYPNTSFPTPFVAPEPYAPVMESPQPSFNPITQAVIQGTPVQTDGEWWQTWTVVDLDAEQIAYNQAQKAQQNKTQATQILSSTDWTAIPDVADPLKSNPYLVNQAEFVTYRSTIRNIAVNPTWDAVFPTAPTEVWSTT